MLNDYNIGLMAIQETKVANNGQECRKGYTWYFSGQDVIKPSDAPKAAQNRFDTGVGIIIKNENE